MDQTTKDRITDRSIWVRALYALFFSVAYTVAKTVITFIVVFQFVAALITGKVNHALLKLSINLNTYVFDMLQFLTFNEETLPFPFSDWPEEEPDSDSPWAQNDVEEEAAQPQQQHTVEEAVEQADKVAPEEDAGSDSEQDQ